MFTKIFDGLLTAISVLFIMTVVFLQIHSFGAIVLTVLAFGWLIRYAWSKEDV